MNTDKRSVRKLWDWLSEPKNQKTLKLLGSAIVAIAIAFWTVFAHFSPSPAEKQKLHPPNMITNPQEYAFDNMLKFLERLESRNINIHPTVMTEFMIKEKEVVNLRGEIKRLRGVIEKQSQRNSYTVVWEPSQDIDVAGYKVFYGTSFGEYTNVCDVGNTTQYTITGLSPINTYYFTATVYDLHGYESPYGPIHIVRWNERECRWSFELHH